ncbi:MAG: hypothetical protein ACE5FT_03465 [Candidatus Nanoarchaeia archaeon]
MEIINETYRYDLLAYVHEPEEKRIGIFIREYPTDLTGIKINLVKDFDFRGVDFFEELDALEALCRNYGVPRHDELPFDMNEVKDARNRALNDTDSADYIFDSEIDFGS